MAEGVRVGHIDTVRPEHTPEAMGRPPRVDGHGGEVYVYRRPGMPCLVCGTEIRTEVLAGRNLFWCPTCQRQLTRVAAPGGGIPRRRPGGGHHPAALSCRWARTASTAGCGTRRSARPGRRC